MRYSFTSLNAPFALALTRFVLLWTSWLFEKNIWNNLKYCQSYRNTMKELWREWLFHVSCFCFSGSGSPHTAYAEHPFSSWPWGLVWHEKGFCISLSLVLNPAIHLINVHHPLGHSSPKQNNHLASWRQNPRSPGEESSWSRACSSLSVWTGGGVVLSTTSFPVECSTGLIPLFDLLSLPAITKLILQGLLHNVGDFWECRRENEENFESIAWTRNTNIN